MSHHVGLRQTNIMGTDIQSLGLGVVLKIAEMIEVFSTVPGKKGLSFDDFQTIIIRSGMVSK